MVREIAAGLADGTETEQERRALLSDGLVAAGFAPLTDLDALPDPLRAVLVAHLDTLTALDADSLRLVCEAMEGILRLAK